MYIICFLIILKSFFYRNKMVLLLGSPKTEKYLLEMQDTRDTPWI